MNKNVKKLLSMTELDWTKLEEMSKLLTEEETDSFCEYFDIGNMSIEEFDQHINAISVDEIDNKINEILDNN